MLSREDGNNLLPPRPRHEQNKNNNTTSLHFINGEKKLIYIIFSHRYYREYKNNTVYFEIDGVMRHNIITLPPPMTSIKKHS